MFEQTPLEKIRDEQPEINYLEIIGEFFPAYEVELVEDGDPTVYDDIVWNASPIIDQATLDTYQPIRGAYLNEPNRILLVINNNTGSVITKGTPVYVTGHHPTVEQIYVAPADASDFDKMPAIGVARMDLVVGGAGHVTCNGHIDGINTSSYSINDPLYVAAGGGLTNVKPTGSNLIQKVATVSKVDGSEGDLIIMSEGRDTSLPNISNGKVWMGDGSSVPTETDVYTETETDSLLSGKTDTGHTHVKAALTDFTETDYLHVTGVETAAGNKTFTGNTKAGHTHNSNYPLSVQSDVNATYLEILNDQGSNKGAFFGLYGNDFELYNWQGGPIVFYTHTSPSSYSERLVIANDGEVKINDLGSGVVKSSATGVLSSGTITKANISDFTESDYVHKHADGSPITEETILGDKTFSNDVVISGNLTVTGTKTINNTEELNIADNIMLLNSDIGSPIQAPTENAGIEIERSAFINASLIWDESADKWKAGLKSGEIEISLATHTHTESDITDLSSYEPAFSKNTAFNKNFGTSLGTVAQGNHTHTSYVSITGNQNITGQKTFEGSLETVASGAQNNIKFVNTSGSTAWFINAGSGTTDNFLLFGAEYEGGDYTAAITDTGQVRLKSGTSAAPSHSFADAPTYGMSYDSGGNEGLVLSTEGTSRLLIEDDGTLSVSGTTTYENLVTSDDDIPNKKYVDDLVDSSHPDPHRLGDGSASVPTYSFSGDTDTGMYRDGGNTLSFSTGGSERFRIWNTGVVAKLQMKAQIGSASAPGYGFEFDPDTGMYYTFADSSLDFSTAGTRRLSVESNGTISVKTSNYETLVTDDDDIPNKKYVDDAVSSGNVFGSEFADIESPGVSSTTSSTLQTKIYGSVGSSFPVGRYRVGWSAAIQPDDNDHSIKVQAQIQINGSYTDLANAKVAMKDGNADDAYTVFSGFGYVNFTVTSSVYLAMRYASNVGTFTTRIKEARMEIWRVS